MKEHISISSFVLPNPWWSITVTKSTMIHDIVTNTFASNNCSNPWNFSWTWISHYDLWWSKKRFRQWRISNLGTNFQIWGMWCVWHFVCVSMYVSSRNQVFWHSYNHKRKVQCDAKVHITNTSMCVCLTSYGGITLVYYQDVGMHGFKESIKM